MAKRVSISGASTAVQAQAQQHVPKALMDLAGTTMQAAHQIDKLNRASKDALTKSQYKMNSLTQDDAWSILDNNNKDNYDENQVFSSIDELTVTQADIVDNDTTLTNQAKDALLLNIQGNANKSKNNYRSNVATAQTKAAIENTNTILAYQVRSGDALGVTETIGAGVSAGIIAPETGAVLQEQAVVDIAYYGNLNAIDGTTQVAELDAIVVGIKADKRYSDAQRNSLLSAASKQQVAVVKDTSKYESFVDDRIKDGSATQDQIDLVQDPVMQSSLQWDYDVKLDEAYGKVKGGIPKRFPVFRTDEERQTAKEAEPIVFKASPERRLDMVLDNIKLFKTTGKVNIPKSIDRDDKIKKWRSLEGQDAYRALMWQIDSGGYDPILKNSLRGQAIQGKLSDNNRVYSANTVGEGVNTWEEDQVGPQTLLRQKFDLVTGVLSEDDKIGLYGAASTNLEFQLGQGVALDEAVEVSLQATKQKAATRALGASLPGFKPATTAVEEINDPMGIR